VAAPSGVAIACEGVSKSFEVFDGGSAWRLLLGCDAAGERFKALEDVTLEVSKGKFVGVIGRNGAGKSTLLRTLGGVYQPDTGKVRVSGSVSGVYELGMGGRRELTGHSYVRRLLNLQGTPRGMIDSAIDDVRRFSELGDRFDDPLYTYSTGMAARLFFSAATAREYDVYLVDEVLSVGDEHFQQKCWRRVRERLAAGASGVLVTHDWSAVLKLCEVAHVLDHGRVVLSGRSDEVVRTYLDMGALARKNRGIARFLEPVPRDLRWASGETCRFDVEVELQQDRVPVYLVYAVERVEVGVGLGWEIILNGIDLEVGQGRGRYRVTVEFERLPLGAGNYELSLDLVTFPRENRMERKTLDSRGWLKGTPIAVRVHGPDSGAHVLLPLRWEVRAA